MPKKNHNDSPWIQWDRDNKREVPLPSSWTLRQSALPKPVLPIRDPSDRLMHELKAWVNSTDTAIKTVTIVIDDCTRNTPVQTLLPVVLEEFRGADVTVITATGSHEPETEDQLRAKVGDALFDRCRCVSHDARAKDAHDFLGRTPRNTPVLLARQATRADLCILIASVVPHLQAGFSGGCKMLFPGLAHIKTIAALHLWGAGRGRLGFVGQPPEQNDMRREIEAAAELLKKPVFAVNLILNENEQICAMACGDPNETQRRLARKARECFGVPIAQKADVVLTGAYPRQYDLRQGFKCVANTRSAARKGGLIVAAMNLEVPPTAPPIPAKLFPSPKGLRRVLKLTGGPAGLVAVLARLAPELNHEARFFARIALEVIRDVDVLIYAPLLVKKGLEFPCVEFFDDFRALWRRAEKTLGPGNQSVVAFPHGGIAYPIIKEV